VDMSVAFIANLQASKRQARQSSARLANAFCRVRCHGASRFWRAGREATFAQALPIWLGAIAPVTLNDLQLVQGMSRFAPGAWSCLDQCVELRNVVTVCAGQDDRERDALRINDEAEPIRQVLRIDLTSARRIAFLPAASSLGQSCTQHRRFTQIDY
jgi:hypothetical protein